MKKRSTLRAMVGFIAICGFSYACSVGKSSSSSSDDDSSATNSSSSGITSTCEEQCGTQFPNGVEAYNTLRSCLLCGACFDVCTDELGSGICEMGAESGCSATSSDCASCINSSCALEQTPDTNFSGFCAGAGFDCSLAADCVSMNNCVSNCVESSGSGPTGSTTTGVGGGGSGGAGGSSN